MALRIRGNLGLKVTLPFNYLTLALEDKKSGIKENRKNPDLEKFFQDEHGGREVKRTILSTFLITMTLTTSLVVNAEDIKSPIYEGTLILDW